MSRGFFSWSVFSLVCWAACGASAQTRDGNPTLDQRIDALLDVCTFKEVALSPDGRWLAWVEEVPPKDGTATAQSAVYISDQRGGEKVPRRLSAGNLTTMHAEHDLAWSPDSRQLAFLSDHDKPGQLQLYVADPETGTVKKLTDVTGHLSHPGFAPQGDQIAILFTENAKKAAGPTHPASVEVGVVGEPNDRQRLSLVDSHTGKVRPLSPPDLNVYEYDWSPDAKQFVAIAALGDGDNNWYIAKLITVAADSGQVQTLLEPKMQIAVPRWSPDGRTIAFIGGLMSDEGVNGGEIYAISARGGTPRNLTPDLKASASWLAWQPSSQAVLFTAHVDGSSGILAADLENGRVTTLWTGAESITAEWGAFGLSVSRDRQTAAVVRQAFDRPPEVWTGPIGKWRQVTERNSSQTAHWGKAESLHWTSDGMTIQGWLLYPKDYDPQRRYPMVVSIHGGPAGATRPAWPRAGFDFSIVSADGYFVFHPNPRGSFGQGQQFVRANYRDFGHGDLRDTQAGIDHIVKSLPVDEQRLGVIGWSYGGYMAMWAVTQTNRFRAAVAGAGIANWQSYYGQNGIDQWLIPFFGASIYDDPAVYARSSPMNFIKNVKTPTLVLVGERDLECPPPQSYEFWRALKRMDVPTQMVVYANEGHRIRQREHRRDIQRRSITWLHRELQPDASPSSSNP